MTERTAELQQLTHLTDEQRAILLCGLLGIDGNEINDEQLPTHGKTRVRVIAQVLMAARVEWAALVEREACSPSCMHEGCGVRRAIASVMRLSR